LRGALILARREGDSNPVNRLKRERLPSAVYQRKVPASCRKLPSRFTSVRVVEVGSFRSKAL